MFMASYLEESGFLEHNWHANSASSDWSRGRGSPKAPPRWSPKKNIIFYFKCVFTYIWVHLWNWSKSPRSQGRPCIPSAWFYFVVPTSLLVIWRLSKQVEGYLFAMGKIYVVIYGLANETFICLPLHLGTTGDRGVNSWVDLVVLSLEKISWKRFLILQNNLTLGFTLNVMCVCPLKCCICNYKYHFFFPHLRIIELISL